MRHRNNARDNARMTGRLAFFPMPNRVPLRDRIPEIGRHETRAPDRTPDTLNDSTNDDTNLPDLEISTSQTSTLQYLSYETLDYDGNISATNSLYT